MAEQFEQDEFEQTGAGWWIRVIGVVVYMLVIVAYAIQTLELVNWLFPSDNWFMKIVTVFVCDGCATGYAMAEMFYRYRLRKAKTLTFGMWVVTFVLSTAATIVQMYLSSTHNIPHAIDPTIIMIAYGLIIVAFVVNIIAITVIIRMEHNASQPQRRYLDDKPRGRKPIAQQASTPVQAPIRKERDTDPGILPVRMQQTAEVRSILAAMSVPPDHEDEVIEQLVKKGVLPAQEPPSPLA